MSEPLAAAGVADSVALVFGTRGSALARAQAGWVIGRLLAALPGWVGTVRIVRTEGDLLQHESDPERVQARLGTGVFTRQLEEELGAGRIDVAVHSLKDLPTAARPGLSVVAIPPRVCPWDLLVLRPPCRNLADLPAGGRVGTSSERRALFLRALRADLTAMPIRGNVDTRLRRLAAGGLDGVVLAAAGLARLGMWQPDQPDQLHTAAGQFSIVRLDPATGFVPAPAQGALAVQMRADDSRGAAVAAALDDPATRSAATAERACLAALGGGCRVPIGAFGEVAGERLRLVAAVAQDRPLRILREMRDGARHEPEEVGRLLAATLLDAGAATILAQTG